MNYITADPKIHLNHDDVRAKRIKRFAAMKVQTSFGTYSLKVAYIQYGQVPSLT